MLPLARTSQPSTFSGTGEARTRTGCSAEATLMADCRGWICATAQHLQFALQTKAGRCIGNAVGRDQAISCRRKEMQKCCCTRNSCFCLKSLSRMAFCCGCILRPRQGKCVLYACYRRIHGHTLQSQLKRMLACHISLRKFRCLQKFLGDKLVCLE